MKIKLLLVAIPLAIIALFLFLRSNKAFASDQWWGCRFPNPVTVSANTPYVVSFTPTNKLSNFSVGTNFTTPYYWYRSTSSSSWTGPMQWYGPKIQFLADNIIRDGVNADAPIEIAWGAPENQERGYEWTTSAGFSLTEVRFYSSDPGNYTIRIFDEVQSDVNDPQTKMPNNLLGECTGASIPPTANAGGPYTGNEGSVITFDGSGSSAPGGSISSWQWDFTGDGLYKDAAGATVVHTWNDDFNGKIGLKVTDTSGNSATASATVNITNVAPIVKATQNPIVTAGQPVTLSGSFTDPGLLDTFTYSWDFGDGTALASGAIPQGIVTSPAHTYTVAGVYKAILKVTDDDGGVGSDSIDVTVVPPIKAIQAMVNFSPTTLSLGSNGNWVTVKIELPTGYDAKNIDPKTLSLQGPVTLDSASDNVSASSYTSTSTGLIIKFDRQKVQGIVQPGDSVEVRVTGKLFDGTVFSGSAVIRVIS